MILEVWMIVGVGAALAIGFGSVTILLLGLHAQIRRLSQVAETAQRLLAANLRQVAAPEARQAAAGPPRPQPPAQPAPAPTTALAPDPELPLAHLSTAVTATQSRAAVSPPAPAAANPAGWDPDRRLLVMRLASRGRTADQIAAALRIPQEEVERFLEANGLQPPAKLEHTPAGATPE